MKKTAALLMIITVLSKVFGFLRDITLTYFYGASVTTDAYFISISITTMLFSFVMTGIASGYIPLYKEIENTSGEKQALDFTNRLLTVVLLITTVLLIVGILFSNQLVTVFALGFNEETKRMAVLFTRIGLVGIYFTSLTQLLASYLQLNGKFTTVAMLGFPFNFIIILSIIISAQTHSIGLAIGSIVASLAQLLFLLPSLLKMKYRYSPVAPFLDENIKKVALFVLPITMGMSVDHINTIVDKTLASKIVEGGISALTYASRLNDFVHGIFVLSFIAILFPHLSKMAAEKSIEEVKRSMREVLSSVILLVVPASIGIMIVAKPIIQLLFGRGQFDEQAILLTAEALFFYSIGMIGYGIREILLRTFYSLQDMISPMVNAAIAVALNIVLNIILSAYMGLNGLALATSISALISVALLWISLRRKIGSLGLKSMAITFLKVLMASGVMGVVIVILNGYVWLQMNELLKMMVIGLVGSSLYFFLLTILKVKESKEILTFMRRKLRL
ncbi:murein biosynthesis integral membrane protein MurJ [Sporosarcina beigongshangi]|uniref:murein biosynthesis integral membrane protein MurJ n=1 Tax=Sporosarcina beigongshangi TaxID=2782538 RepID=UPI002ACE6F19|nr:murein biosynthesis integral membrane protein MurJ [Sporosarcina beigongshangi]